MGWAAADTRDSVLAVCEHFGLEFAQAEDSLLTRQLTAVAAARHRRDMRVVPTVYEYFMLLTYWILRDLWLCKTQFCLNSKRYVGGS